MVIFISAIFTLFLVGISTGGLLVSRRIDPHQTLFLGVGLAFFLFSFIGMFFGGLIVGVVSSGVISIFLGVFCLGLIGYLIWKYDPAFGFVKQDPVSLSIFAFFFFILGIELALLELSIWFSIFGALIFSGGLFLGFMFIYRLIFQNRTPQIFALIPLIPLLFIGLFKLI